MTHRHSVLSLRASRSLIATLVVSLGCVIVGPVRAESPAPLPHDDDVRRLRTAIEIGARTVADRLNRGDLEGEACRVDGGVLHCTCIEGDDVRYDEWREGEASGVALVYGDQRVFAGTAIALDTGWVLTNVWWELRGRVVHAEEAYVSADDVRLSAVEWFEAPDAPVVDVSTCGATPLLERSPVARADGATWTAPDGWRLGGYRVGPWPILFGESGTRAAPGLLPPTLRLADGSWSAIAEGAIGESATVWAGAAGTPEVDALAGVGVVTRRHGVYRKLDLGLTSAAEPVVEGIVDVGGPVHLRGRFEHPTPDRVWALRRLENDAFFRDWRVTRVGASLGGDAHALQLAGVVTTGPELLEPQWDGLLTYAVDVDGGRLAKWTVDVDHASETSVDTTHSSTASVGWRAPLGPADTVWITPGADIVANYAAVSALRGFDASTTISLLASGEAGIGVEGRFDEAVHRIVARLRAGGELYGVQQRQPEEGAPPYPYERPDRWRWSVATLEQSLQHGPFTAALPVGVFSDAIGDEGIDELGSPIPFARLVASISPLSTQVGVACPRTCADPAYQIGGAVTGRATAAWYSASNLSARTAAIVWADQLTQRGHTAVRLVNDEELEPAFSHHAGLRLRRGPASSWVSGRFVERPDSWGLTAGLSWTWDALGWGLSASGGWKPSTGEAAVVAGFSLAP